MNIICFTFTNSWTILIVMAFILLLIGFIVLFLKLKSLQKKQAESELPTTTETTSKNGLYKRSEFIIANAKDGIYISNFEGAFTYVNDSMKNLLGYDENELLSMHFSDVIFEDDKEMVRLFYKNQLVNNIDATYLEFRIIEKNGRCRWVAQNVQTISNVKDETKVVEFHSIARDITTRKVYEIELDRLSLVARKTKNIIFFLDSDFRINWVNDEFTTVFGYKANEVKGKMPGAFLNGPKTNKETVIKIEKQLKNKESLVAEILNYTKEGQEIWVEITMDPYYSSYGELGYIAVEQEVTEKKMQRNLILTQNKEITDSINYSRKIQLSTIPKEADRKKILANSFVYYSPKEVVSGDFYLIDTLKLKGKERWPVVVVADCTGHGVPGAMLSLMCSGILKQAFSQEDLTSPCEILEFTREKVAAFLNSGKTNEIYDGMDLAICLLDEKNNTIHFSGANRPLWLIQEGELIEYKGDRQPIGYSQKNEAFTSIEIKVNEGDVCYLFTDGIIDQFGGERNKRFMSKTLKNLLLEIAHLDVEKQDKIIKKALRDWQGANEQTDDICLIGMKF